MRPRASPRVLPSRSLARQRKHHSHGERQRQRRRPAVGYERQGRALGRNQVKGRGHVDRGLQSEQREQPGHGEKREGVVLGKHPGQAAQDDKGEQRDEDEAGDQPELFAGDGEDEVCVGPMRGTYIRVTALLNAINRYKHGQRNVRSAPLLQY